MAINDTRQLGTAAHLISKDVYYAYKDDETFVDHITSELTTKMVELLTRMLEKNDEIILKKPVLKVTELPLLNSIEYRKLLACQPLVRCKNCKHRTGEAPGMICCDNITGGWVPDIFFCAYGEENKND